MTEPSTDTLDEINFTERPLKGIHIPKKVDYLKGSITLSTTIFFKLECQTWDEFIQFLEPIHRFDLIGKSPTMPIVVNYEQIGRVVSEMVGLKATFTALAGLTYPTLLTYHIEKTTINALNKKQQLLEDCGYVVMEGKLSFYKKEGE